MSAPEAPEPSGTSRQPEPEPEPEPERKWVALLSAPVILDDDDDKRDMELELDAPPRPSRLLLRNRCSPDPRRRKSTEEAPSPSAYILATAADRSGRVLVQYGGSDVIYLLDVDPSARTVTRLPRVPSSLRVRFCPDRSIGLIVHPHSPAHFVVAQLHPGRHLRRPRHQLLFYSTFSSRGAQGCGRWNAKELAQPEGCTRDPSAEHGVVAHDGRLWWLSLASGIFYCDPLGTEPLRFVPLPAGCELGDDIALDPGTATLVKQRQRRQAALRGDTIRGLSYGDDVPQAHPTFRFRVWTLLDPEGTDPWQEEYQTPFAEIWKNNTYIQAGLPRRVPHVAFVDPDDSAIVYFLHGSNLFGFNTRKRQVVVACEEGFGGDGEHSFHRPIVHVCCKLGTPAVTPMEHSYPPGTYLRILVSDYEGNNGYLEPKEDMDGRGIMLNAWGGRIPHSAWMVNYIKQQGGTWMVLQNSASGRYLARQDGLEAKAAVLVDYEQPEQEELLWQFRMEPGIPGGGFLDHYRHGVWRISEEPCKFEPILSTRTPPHLPPPPTGDVCVLRMIKHLRANDAGNFNEGYSNSTPFYGCSICKLRTAVLQLQQLMMNAEEKGEWIHLGLSQPENNDVLCVRPGTYGRLTPLVTDLPRSQEVMVIGVLPNGSSAAKDLRYPTLDEA